MITQQTISAKIDADNFCVLSDVCEMFRIKRNTLINVAIHEFLQPRNYQKPDQFRKYILSCIEDYSKQRTHGLSDRATRFVPPENPEALAALQQKPASELTDEELEYLCKIDADTLL